MHYKAHKGPQGLVLVVAPTCVSFLFVSLLDGANRDGSGEGRGGRILKDALSRGLEGVLGGGGPRGGPQKGFVRVRVLEDLRSFWAWNDRPNLGTMTNQKWPCLQADPKMTPRRLQDSPNTRIKSTTKSGTNSGWPELAPEWP